MTSDFFKKSMNNKQAFVGWEDLSYAYIEGYRQAGNLIFEQCKNNLDNNTLVFPIVFVYRHFLELKLKSIFSKLNFFIENEPLIQATKRNNALSKIMLDNHNLKQVWEQIIELRKKLSEEDSRFLFPKRDRIAIINKCVDEFTQNDSGGMAFRYPYKPSFQKTLPEKLDWIDLQNLVSKLEEVANSLDEFVCRIEIAQDEKRQADADFAADSYMDDY